MKFLCTRLCRFPEIQSHADRQFIILSFDDELWRYSFQQNDFKDFYFDHYGMPVNSLNDDCAYHLQPRNSNTFNHANHECIPCIMAVSESDYVDWINETGYEPIQSVYLESQLVFLGYEVMDSLFISIRSHGVTEDIEQYLNKFALFDDIQSAYDFLKLNTFYNPEHCWRIIGVYTSIKGFDILKSKL